MCLFFLRFSVSVSHMVLLSLVLLPGMTRRRDDDDGKKKSRLLLEKRTRRRMRRRSVVYTKSTFRTGKHCYIMQMVERLRRRTRRRYNAYFNCCTLPRNGDGATAERF